MLLIKYFKNSNEKVFVHKAQFTQILFMILANLILTKGGFI